MILNVKTKPKCLVLCDMSACEVRTAVNASQDPKMLDAYRHGKDLYSIIGSMIYNKPYEDCLEFYPEGTEIIFEGEKVIAGNEKETDVDVTNDKFEVEFFKWVDTPKGWIVAKDLKIGDGITTDEGIKQIENIEQQDELIIFTIK